MKPVRRKIVRAYEPTRGQGVWTRWVNLSCGHNQFISASTYSRVPKTTVCHKCSRKECPRG